MLKQMLNLYVPVNLCGQEMPDIADYFLYIKENNEMRYYKKLLLPLEIKELIIYLTKIKKKYTYNEIKGLMGHIFSEKNLQEAVNKHFRKFGDQYELKAIMVAWLLNIEA